MLPKNGNDRPFSIASVIASLTSGGIGPVCRYAAEAMSRTTSWRVTLVSLHDPVAEFFDETSGLRIVCLGLDVDCAPQFLLWLNRNHHDLVITSDVSRIEPAFRFFPYETRHIVQIHDSGRRYRDVATRHATWIDGVTCVGRHIEAPLRRSLAAVGFQGLLRPILNGANFPPLRERLPYAGPPRLLFTGRVEAMKGVFDFAPLLQRLKRMGVPVALNIVGGENAALRRQLIRKGVSHMVTWMGRVSHERCYEIAAESDLFMMTSRKEPFGMVTIEAMSMGCVPIAYDTPSGSTEIIEHNKSGLLVPLGDIRGWAAMISDLYIDRQRSRAISAKQAEGSCRLDVLSAGAIERARKYFNADVMATNWISFVTDVMGHAQQHPARREAGLPLAAISVHVQRRRGYQRLPAGLRNWIRDKVGSSPRLSYWLLSR